MLCSHPGGPLREVSLEVKGSRLPWKLDFETSVLEVREALRQGHRYALVCLLSLDTARPAYMLFEGVGDLLQTGQLEFSLEM